jgi:hypothetical protein
MAPEIADSERTPTIRHREHVDGCGCLRCQGVGYTAVRESFAEAFRWSVGLLWRRPTIVVAFLAIAAVQLAAARSPFEPGLVSALVGVVGVFLGRGYVGLLGAADLSSGPTGRGTIGRTVAVRFPSFLVAFSITVAAAAAAILLIGVGVASAIEVGLGHLGVGTGVVLDVGLLVAAVLCGLGVLVKCCFVPEACFVGGYGPIAAVRMSWRLTTVHRRKALVLTAGLAALFAVSALLELGEASGRPVILSMTLGSTTVSIRSIGLSTAGPLRLVADTVLSALYYGVFVHQYVHGLFEAEG